MTDTLVIERIVSAVQAEKRCMEGTAWKGTWAEVVDELGNVLANTIHPCNAFEVVEATAGKVIIHFVYTITTEWDTAVYSVKVLAKPTFSGIDYHVTLRGKCTYQARKIWKDNKDYVEEQVYTMLNTAIGTEEYRALVEKCLREELPSV